MAKLAAGYEWTPEEELALWKEARVYASQGKSTVIRGKALTRRDLPEINAMITQLENRIAGRSGRQSVVLSRHGFR